MKNKRIVMTRNELNTTLKKLENYIEVQQLFITTPLCCCISEIQDKFMDSNIESLNEFMSIQNILKELEKEDDSTLEKVAYIPLLIKQIYTK